MVGFSDDNAIPTPKLAHYYKISPSYIFDDVAYGARVPFALWDSCFPHPHIFTEARAPQIFSLGFGTRVSHYLCF